MNQLHLSSPDSAKAENPLVEISAPSRRDIVFGGFASALLLLTGCNRRYSSIERKPPSIPLEDLKWEKIEIKAPRVHPQWQGHYNALFALSEGLAHLIDEDRYNRSLGAYTYPKTIYPDLEAFVKNAFTRVEGTLKAIGEDHSLPAYTVLASSFTNLSGWIGDGRRNFRYFSSDDSISYWRASADTVDDFERIVGALDFVLASIRGIPIPPETHVSNKPSATTK
jgi:hypothetical protein